MKLEIPRNSMRCFRKCTNWEKNWVLSNTALIDELENIEPESEVGHEISSTLDALDNLCGG